MTTKTYDWTVGMAVYDQETKEGVQPESIRAVFTAMSLIVHHPLVKEVIVVDNNPLPESCLPRFAAQTGGKVRYVPLPSPTGTMPPKNQVFKEARTEYVCCIDSHVLLCAGFFEGLSQFYETHAPERHDDLLQGVLVTEAMRDLGTHFNDQWRGEMWGTWGRTYLAKNGLLFSVMDLSNEATCYVTMPLFGERQRLLTSAEIVDAGLPAFLPFSGHENALYNAGCKHPEKPFQIPGQGMGMFACRKDSWLPFDPRCRGFGGEEMTTHLRFHQAGRATWCLPQLKWWHHFERAHNAKRGGGGVPYPLTKWDKMRNYVLEFQNLKLDPQVVKDHMRPPEGEWQQVLTGVEWPDGRGVDPATYAPSREVLPSNWSKNNKCAGSDKPMDELRGQAMAQLFMQVKQINSPIRDDLQTLHDLAMKCAPGRPATVVELGTHTGYGTTAFLAAKPGMLVTFHDREVPHVNALKQYVPEATAFGAMIAADTAKEDIPDCDLLFVNTEPHDWRHTLDELNRHHARVRRFVAIHGSTVYGDSHNGAPGVLAGARAFLKEHSEWKAVALHPTPSGLLVLSRNQEDWPEKEIDLGKGPTPVKVPETGPGAELKKLLSTLGVEPPANCDCNSKVVQMNVWGVEGCKKNFNTVVGWMRDGEANWGWDDKVTDEKLREAKVRETTLKAVGKAIWSGLGFKINPLDKWPSLINLAIKNAEQETVRSQGVG